MATSATLFSDSLVFLGAAVVAVPIFKRLKLGSVLGYLFAGLVIGPHGAKFFKDPQSVLHFAELGVVLLLFVIGLELKPSRLWSMRRDIFGTGLAQVVLTAAALASAGLYLGFDLKVAIVAGLGLALSSTAFALQILAERGEMNTAHGQKAFSVLLFQDLAIVPLLILINLLSPISVTGGDGFALKVVIAVAAIAGLVLAGRYLLNPFFRILALAKAREIMTAAALLVVLGAAVLMEVSGLSMAMGAFLAGVMLAESSFRHQLEADIEPFRGILMGLFFMAVGMTVDLSLVLTEWLAVLIGVGVLVALKFVTIFLAVRAFKETTSSAIRCALLLSQGGEFAFLLFTTAVSARVMDPAQASLLTAVVTISMALTPALVLLGDRMTRAEDVEEMQETYDGAAGTVLVIGFGRFGQIAAQMLLAEGMPVTIIDNDPNRIRTAGRFGFRIYYGDGTQLSVLRAAGAGQARVIAVCNRNRRATDKILELCAADFPLAKLYVRAYDRNHAIDLISRDVSYQIRETFESAMVFGRAVLEEVGVDPDRARDIERDVRERDLMRLAVQQVEGRFSGMDIVHHPVKLGEQRKLTPEPLTQPRRRTEALTPETAEIAESEDEETETKTEETDDDAAETKKPADVEMEPSEP